MKITYKKIMSFNPCYDPKKIGMPEDYEDKLKNFIIDYKNKVRDLGNIIWVCCRKVFFNDRDFRLFGVWSALQVKSLMKDQRSLDCLEVVEKFAFGEANEEELESAAVDAARAAARAAAWAAAVDAAGAAAWAAARAAARAAAGDAAGAAAWAADGAAAGDAAGDAQIQTLLKMIEKPNGEWFKEWKAKHE